MRLIAFVHCWKPCGWAGGRQTVCESNQRRHVYPTNHTNAHTSPNRGPSKQLRPTGATSQFNKHAAAPQWGITLALLECITQHRHRWNMTLTGVWKCFDSGVMRASRIKPPMLSWLKPPVQQTAGVSVCIKSGRGLTLTRLSNHHHHSCDPLREPIGAYRTAIATAMKLKPLYWTYGAEEPHVPFQIRLIQYNWSTVEQDAYK